MSDEFSGITAVVTGGASGIGAATVAVLRARGARVAVLDRTIAGVEPSEFAYACDIADRASVQRAVDAVARDLGRLDILVNNAGVGAVGSVADNGDEEWERVLGINVVGTARVSAAALPYLRESPAAAIVNVSSIAARNGLPQRALYSASKGAVEALTRAMATDHLADGIRVNAVAPGTADTPWVGRLLDNAADPAAERRALEARQPHRRLVSPDEIARAIAFLASPTSASVTGIVLDVDGGMTTLRPRREDG